MNGELYSSGWWWSWATLCRLHASLSSTMTISRLGTWLYLSIPSTCKWHWTRKSHCNVTGLFLGIDYFWQGLQTMAPHLPHFAIPTMEADVIVNTSFVFVLLGPFSRKISEFQRRDALLQDRVLWRIYGEFFQKSISKLNLSANCFSLSSM